MSDEHPTYVIHDDREWVLAADAIPKRELRTLIEERREEIENVAISIAEDDVENKDHAAGVSCGMNYVVDELEKIVED
jgi:hypothetical protein